MTDPIKDAIRAEIKGEANQDANVYLIKRATSRHIEVPPCDGSFKTDEAIDKYGNRYSWRVNIPSLREFIKKEGQCVLTLVGDQMAILIYDDYIE